MNNWIGKNLELFLPRYLSDITRNSLIDALSQFPDNIDQRLYAPRNALPESILQGDGVGELIVCQIPTRRFYQAPCIVLSNSCDIDPRNRSYSPVNVCYAPIFRLSKLEQELTRHYAPERTANILFSIRKQYVSQYFYLPQNQGLDYEGVVSLDQVCSTPNTEEFYESLKRMRVFSLSQYGFYLFLFKLSVHFTRMGEGVDRDILPA